MRRNDASRWVANDIIRKGNNYQSYDKLPGGANYNSQGNYSKIPPELRQNLDADALRIQKLKMELETTNGQRMETPAAVKQHAARQSLPMGTQPPFVPYQAAAPVGNYGSVNPLPSASPPNVKTNKTANDVSDRISQIKLAYLAQGGQDPTVIDKIQKLETLSAAQT